MMKKIMIADDDKEFLNEFREMLVLNNYDAVAVSDSNMVIEEARRVKPDVIILDIVMNGHSGFQIARDLKTHSTTAHIPVIAISGYFIKDTHAELAKVYGMKKLLCKPINPEQVVRQIELVLAQNK